MKKVFGVMIATLCGATAVMAQSPGVHFGVRGGLNLANIIKDGDNNYKTELKPGFSAGAFADIGLVKGFGLQPELMFSQKGYKTSGSFFGSDYEYNVTTNFIEVPLLAKFSPTAAFSILAGPQFSFLTSTNYKFKSGPVEYQDMVKEENDNIRKNVLGGVVGVEFNAGANAVIGARYALDLQSNKGDGTNTTPTYKNQVFNVSVGFKL